MALVKGEFPNLGQPIESPIVPKRYLFPCPNGPDRKCVNGPAKIVDNSIVWPWGTTVKSCADCLSSKPKS
jgi:hypothetical protein